METLEKTPLWAWHTAHHARMAPFGGFDMPVEYPGGIIAEHHAVRSRAGMFDVSHMGEFLVEGPLAGAFLDFCVTNSVAAMTPGRALYSPMCNAEGGTVDDLLVYRLADERFGVVVNAATRAKDWAWIESVRQPWLARQAAVESQVEVHDVSCEMGLIAVQGPEARDIVASLSAPETLALRRYTYAPAVVAGCQAWVSRTGYTGEDGFEIFLRAADVLTVWDALAEAGVPPAGLGARDTLRLEAGLPLYGHELSDTITPLEAGLSRFVAETSKAAFMGREALQRSGKGLRHLVGLLPEGGIARAGYPVVHGDRTVGTVTSGTFSPTLRRPIALALVDAAVDPTAAPVAVLVRGRRVPAEVTAPPFYRRSAK